MSETPSRVQHVLEDPSAKAVARVYAVAFLDAATSNGVEDPVGELVSFRDDVLERFPEFADLLTGSHLNRDEKLALLERSITAHCSEFFANFLRVLARHERLQLFPAITEVAIGEQMQRRGQRAVKLRSALPLTEEQLNRVLGRLRAALSAEPVVTTAVDEDLLGGLVVQVGDTIFDGSLRTRLRDLKSKLRERYLHEIQSGRDRFGNPEGN